VLQKEIAQKQDHVLGSDLSSNMRGQTLAGVLIENVQNPKGPAILRPVCDEVIGSHLIGPLGPEPKARSIGAPQLSAFWLRLRHLQAFVPPDGIHTIFLHRPPPPGVTARESFDSRIARIPWRAQPRGPKVRRARYQAVDNTAGLFGVAPCPSRHGVPRPEARTWRAPRSPAFLPGLEVSRSDLF